MRSVFTFLPACTKAEVQRFFQRSLPCSGSELHPPRAEIVTIDFHEDLRSEDPETFEVIACALGPDFIGVSADITGRSDGVKAATLFCVELLEQFGGFANDDYSDHFWSLEELKQNSTYLNHTFFDTWGWSRETSSSSGQSNPLHAINFPSIPDP